MPVPPRFAPPLLDVVLEVPCGGGFVAPPPDVLVPLDELLVVVVDAGAELVLVAVVGAVLVLVGVDEDELELLVRQSRAASSLTVLAP